METIRTSEEKETVINFLHQRKLIHIEGFEHTEFRSYTIFEKSATWVYTQS